jgi:hypothetical protein
MSDINYLIYFKILNFSMSNIFRNIFKIKSKVNSQTSNNEKMASEGIKMNIKGQRVNNSFDGANMEFNTNEKDFVGKSKGPPMLNMKTRAKVWGALVFFGVYFYLTYRLIIFRLKSDDLELMEREVNEEFKLKTKINEINNKN